MFVFVKVCFFPSSGSLVFSLTTQICVFKLFTLGISHVSCIVWAFKHFYTMSHNNSTVTPLLNSETRWNTERWMMKTNHFTPTTSTILANLAFYHRHHHSRSIFNIRRIRMYRNLHSLVVFNAVFIASLRPLCGAWNGA